MDLKELIEREESQDLEFKESLRLKDEIGETVSAFSNSDGGTVIVGVSNSSSEMRRLAKESGGRVYWDERVCEDASLEDIEEDKVRWYLERREEIRKVKKPEKMDIDTLLLNIGAAKKVNSETKPTNFEPADTRVAIFDDRIEIISPGTFPEGVTPEEPKHVPVNPILCQLMYDVGFIEKYGSGIYMINELSDLVEKGLVKRVGRGRGSYYVPNI